VVRTGNAWKELPLTAPVSKATAVLRLGAADAYPLDIDSFTGCDPFAYNTTVGMGGLAFDVNESAAYTVILPLNYQDYGAAKIKFVWSGSASGQYQWAFGSYKLSDGAVVPLPENQWCFAQRSIAGANHVAVSTVGTNLSLLFQQGDIVTRPSAMVLFVTLLTAPGGATGTLHAVSIEYPEN
jgi:hypothetical protein